MRYTFLNVSVTTRSGVAASKSPLMEEEKSQIFVIDKYVILKDLIPFRTLELKTPFYDCQPGWYKVAVKVVDIFGNDTMKIADVSVGR